ncbi:MAG: NADPH-dependent FMN reductase, partial [Hyphomicrobiaceae bacterium]
MTALKIYVVVGSLRKDSFNHKLALALTKLAPADVTFAFSEIGNLPLYNQDDDANQAAPVKRLKAEI